MSPDSRRETKDSGLRLSAPAKVNLGLEVLARRPDGFHEIRTILQTIALADDLDLEPADRLHLTCDAPELACETNLVWRAATLLQDRYAPGRGAAIRLTKRIPVAAGLGGGSSDAAATLVGLNELWELGLSTAELRSLAAELGSDIPFFVGGGTQLAEGRGELLRPLPALPPAWLLVVVPPLTIANKTATLYGQLTDPDRRPSADFDRALAAVERGDWPEPDDLRNAFRAVYDREYPAIVRWLTYVQGLTGGAVHLSGAGPALFWRAPDEATARHYADFLRTPETPAWAVLTSDHAPLRRA